MELSNPPALWLLGLLVILLLLPRLRRPRARRAIGNAYMWRSVELSGAPRLVVRVRNWPILQAAVMCLLVAAVARPTAFRTERHVAVVLDLSASMSARDGDQTRFDLARDGSLAFLRELPRRSRVRLVGAGTMANDLGEYTARDPALIARLQELRPGAGSASLDSAISTARALAGSGADVHVFSDQPSRAGATGWVRVGSPADNVAITAMSARRLTGSPLDAQLLVEVHNFGASPREVPITIRHDQSLVHHAVVRIGPRRSHTLVQNVSDPLGVYSATIELQDALAVDNQRFSILGSTPRTRVTLLTRAHPFLEAALKANPSLDVHDVPAANLADSEGVVVCEVCGKIPDGASGVLMIVPPKRGAASARLRVADARHPIMADVDFGNVNARVESVLEPPATASVLIRGGEVPALVAFEDKGRRVVVFQLDIDASNVPLQVAFPVLVANAMNWLGAAAAPVVVVAGEPVLWHSARDGRVVVTPDGRTIPSRRSGTQSIFADTDLAGVYRVGGGGEPSAFVVNPATDSESDLSDAPPVSTSPSAPAAAAEGSRTRTDLFTALVVAGFLVAALDWRRYCRMGRT